MTKTVNQKAWLLVLPVFAVVAFFTSALALCARLGAYLTGLNAAIALFFQALAASLMTYVRFRAHMYHTTI